MYWMIEFTYPEGSQQPVVSYAVEARLEFDAIQRIQEHHHPGFTWREVSKISEEEYVRLRSTRLEDGVWRITRESTHIVSSLNSYSDQAAGHSFINILKPRR